MANRSIMDLFNDFILRDRRLADIAGGNLQVSDERAPEKGGTNLGPLILTMGGTVGFVGLRAMRIAPFELPGLSGIEMGQLALLADVLTFCEAAQFNKKAAAERLGGRLKIARESLGSSASELAGEVQTTLCKFSDWEGGFHLPKVQDLYRWLRSLGLVCPPRTALVRFVDFSPDLLRFLQEDPTLLRSLTPDEFECFVAERMDRMGYNVTLTGASNRKDGGIDLIAVPKSANVGSIVIAGQVKHHRGDQNTGRDAVDRLLAWKDSYFGVGLLVTNTAFTHDAVWIAQQERNARFLRLRDFTDLKRWLEGRFGEEEDWREIPDRIELAPGVVIEIPRPRITSVFQGQGLVRDASQVKMPRTKKRT
jgi:transcriptional regulator with XRE-family HTH domain